MISIFFNSVSSLFQAKCIEYTFFICVYSLGCRTIKLQDQELQRFAHRPRICEERCNNNPGSPKC